MLNKIRFFGGEIKRSLLFFVTVSLQIAISIFLLNMTFTQAFNTTVEAKYYSSKVDSNSYV